MYCCAVVGADGRTTDLQNRNVSEKRGPFDKLEQRRLQRRDPCLLALILAFGHRFGKEGWASFLFGVHAVFGSSVTTEPRTGVKYQAIRCASTEWPMNCGMNQLGA
jgi:hypothetical protein